MRPRPRIRLRRKAHRVGAAAGKGFVALATKYIPKSMMTKRMQRDVDVLKEGLGEQRPFKSEEMLRGIIPFMKPGYETLESRKQPGVFARYVKRKTGGTFWEERFKAPITGNLKFNRAGNTVKYVPVSYDSMVAKAVEARNPGLRDRNPELYRDEVEAMEKRMVASVTVAGNAWATRVNKILKENDSTLYKKLVKEAEERIDAREAGISAMREGTRVKHKAQIKDAFWAVTGRRKKVP